MNGNTATTPTQLQGQFYIEPIVRFLATNTKEVEALNKRHKPLSEATAAELKYTLIAGGDEVLKALSEATAVLYSLCRLHDAGIELGASKIMGAVSLALAALETADNNFTCHLEGVGAIQYKAHA